MKKYIFKVTKTQNKQINKSKNQIKYFNNNKRAKFKTSNRINNKENQDNLLNEKEEIDFCETKSSNNSYNKENNNNDELNNNSENKIKKANKIKKEGYLLGKKRRLLNYKQHSLEYNELNKLLNKEEIELNINSLYSYTDINPSKIRGHFIGILFTDNNKEDNSKCDFVIEINNKNNNNYNQFIVYSSQTFQKKLSFLENCGGQMYILYKGYALFYHEDSIKIYHFSNNNTNFDIFQKIILPEKFQHSILFFFKFVHNDNYYFFYKLFSLKKEEQLLLYKFNKDEKKDENDYAISGNTFIEDKTLDIDYEFIWFSQKNNNELLFFYELDNIFKINCFDLSTNKITQRKTFTLYTPKYIKIANYPDNIINNRFLVLSLQNLLYIIDTEIWDILVVKELDIIEYFNVFNDNTLWTIESCEKTIILDNNKKREISSLYVRQYKIDIEMQELIKIGERKINRNYSLINKIVQINNKKVVLFVEGKKLILLN
jgi:hypothetical protein